MTTISYTATLYSADVFTAQTFAQDNEEIGLVSQVNSLPVHYLTANRYLNGVPKTKQTSAIPGLAIGPK